MATYYVSPTGNDLSAGTSTGTAWRTLAHSVSELVAGDTLNLMDGVYSGEKFLVNKSGTSGNPITIQIVDLAGNDFVFFSFKYRQEAFLEFCFLSKFFFCNNQYFIIPFHIRRICNQKFSFLFARKKYN